MYGPNTNTSGGSIIVYLEAQANRGRRDEIEVGDDAPEWAAVTGVVLDDDAVNRPFGHDTGNVRERSLAVAGQNAAMHCFADTSISEQ